MHKAGKYHTSTGAVVNGKKGKGKGKKYPTGTGKSTGHKAYRSKTGAVMDGFYDSELGEGNKNYINKMASGY